jgi:hypothetical protein
MAMLTSGCLMTVPISISLEELLDKMNVDLDLCTYLDATRKGLNLIQDEGRILVEINEQLDPPRKLVS